MSGRRYVDEGSMRVERIDDRFKVRFNISSSVKAVASRVRTHPKSELKSVACVRVNNGKIEHIPITVADFVAFVYLLAQQTFWLGFRQMVVMV